MAFPLEFFDLPLFPVIPNVNPAKVKRSTKIGVLRRFQYSYLALKYSFLLNPRSFAFSRPLLIKSFNSTLFIIISFKDAS